MPLDATGYSPKSLTAIKADVVARLKAALGDTIHADPDVYPDAVLAGLVEAISPSLAELHQLIGSLYDSHRRGNATGIHLDNLAGLVGLTRLPATFASGTVQLTGVAGTVVPAGTIFSASGVEGSTLVLLDTVTLDGSGDGEGDVQAETAGALVVLDTEVDTIVTPVAGLSGVVNDAALNAGEDAESDAALRARMVLALQTTGQGTDGALRARLLDVAQVEQVRVVSNRTDAVVNGQPAHSVHAIVWPDIGIDEDAIAAVLYNNLPSGIESHGARTADVTNSQGQTATVKWSYATAVPMGVRLTYVKTAAFPVDGQDQLRDAVLAVFDGVEEDDDLFTIVGDGLDVGETVRIYRIIQACATVAGLDSLTVELSKVATADPPTGLVNVAMDDDEIATIVTGKIYLVES